MSVSNLPARLSATDKGRLAIEIVASYTRVMWLLRRAPLPSAIAALRAHPRDCAGAPAGVDAVRVDAVGVDAVGVDAVGVDAVRDGRRLASAVVRTLQPLPRGSRCLTRSLVLVALLARRGVAGDLVIAVQPSVAASLDAHAWVEVDGSPLLATVVGYGRLVTL